MANKKHNISDELLAAYMDGNTTLEETQMMLDAVAEDAELQEFMQFSIKIDEEQEGIDLCLKPTFDRPLPMSERAAKNTVDNLCAIRCEGYALRSFGVDVSDEVLEQEARKNNLLREDGMPLHNIGVLSVIHGSFTSQGYCSSLNDITNAIKVGKVVIVVIDNTELALSSPWEARRKDLDLGEHPNHAVIIKSLNHKKRTIDIYEPGNSDTFKTYPLDIFIESWNDSCNYLVTISNHTKYEPHPQDLSDVELEDELTELREAIANNVHEVWAEARKFEGWTYGPQRDDEKKLHPDMLPYFMLPESEKNYDRQMAMSTIKLVKKLGWDFVKRKNRQKPNHDEE